MEIHDRLSLVIFRICVQKTLIRHPIEIPDREIRNEFDKPCVREQVLPHSHFSNGTLLVDGDPLLVVIAERIGTVRFAEHIRIFPFQTV